MGRPVNKRNFGDPNYASTGEKVGGEGVATVVIATPIAASMNDGATATFSAPQIAGGQTATGTVSIDGSGDIASITITNAGSGYTSVPTITITDTVGGGGETATLTSGSGGVTITLTSSKTDAIAVQARYSGTNRTSGNDIIKQVGSKRFKVATTDGTRVFALVDSTPDAAGEMAIVATDSDSGTYFVKKLYNRVAILTPDTGTQFTAGQKVKWNLTSAVEDVSVTIANV
jgi:hypothetical protein